MWRALVCGWLCLATCVGVAQAQRWPERPLRLMLGFAPSGSADIIARVFAEQLQKQLGVNVIPDNRPGAGGTLAYTTVANAAPDGYTMLFVTPSFVTASVIYKNLQFDPQRAFAAVTHVANGPANVLVVNPNLPVKTLQDLVKLAKTRNVSYGSPGVGAVQHFVAELFNLRAGVKLAHIPYKGQAPALTALLGDEVNVVFLQPPGGVDLIKAGRIRALAYAGAGRWPVMPDLPTVTEAGIPDFQLAGPYEGILVPARTPPELIKRLHADITRTLETPQLRAALAQATWTADGRGPVEFGQFMRAEMKRYAQIAREASITAQ